MDQLPNYISKTRNRDDEVGDRLIKYVDEILFDLGDDTLAPKQGSTKVPIGSDLECYLNHFYRDSNKISSLVTSTLSNVFDTIESFEQNETQSRDWKSFEQTETQSRDWASKGPLIQGVRAVTASETNLVRFHKKLRILREARQRK